MLLIKASATYYASQITSDVVDCNDSAGFTYSPQPIAAEQSIGLKTGKYDLGNPIIRPPSSMDNVSASMLYSYELPSIDNVIGNLQQYRKNKDLVHSRDVYFRLCEFGLETHVSVGNFLVPMLVECGNMSMAEQVFEKLIHQNEYGWTSLLHGFVDCGEPQLALDAFQRMKGKQVHPSVHTFVALLKACENLQDLKSGRKLHIDLVKWEYEGHPHVSNSLICMYSRCGLISDAERVFEELPAYEIVSSTTMMSAYVESGLNEEALNCWDHIRAQGIMPDSFMFVCSLKACARLGAICEGQQIHADVIVEELESSSFISNSLIEMYAKCGLLVEAQELFEDLPIQDTVSWTTLLNGFLETGYNEKVLECLEKIGCAGIVPDVVMYISCLKACGNIGAVHIGLKLHEQSTLQGYDVDLRIGNVLIDMYAKSGMLLEAQTIFHQLPVRDVISWTALVAGYADCGCYIDVENCLNKMQLEGCSPNVATYVCSLKACIDVEVLHWGQEMHSMFVKHGIERDNMIGSALVDMYAKGGAFLEAEAVLNNLPVKDVISWSALIAGYAEHGASEAVMKCLVQMEQVGLSPTTITLISCLKACTNAKTLTNGYKIHAEILKRGFERDLLCQNALIGMYVSCGLLLSSQSVFDKMSSWDIISWTTLIAGYAEHGLWKESMAYLSQMQMHGSFPDIMLWNNVLSCSNRRELTEETLLAFAILQEQGLLPNRVTFMNILHACNKTVAVETGQRIHAQIHEFIKLEDSEPVIFTAIIDMYAKCGSMTNAQQVFDMMSKRDVVQWNALITGYAHQGKSELVFQSFDKMILEGIIPDEITFTSILSVCSHAGLVSKAQTYYEIMVNDYKISPTTKHLGCMVDLLGRVGRLDEALSMLYKMPQPDVVAWNSVLGASQELGNIELSEQAFESLTSVDEQDATSIILISNMYAHISL